MKSATVVTTFPVRSSIENIPLYSRYQPNGRPSTLQPRRQCRRLGCSVGLRLEQAVNGSGETCQCRSVQYQVDADGHAYKISAGGRPVSNQDDSQNDGDHP